MLCSLLNVEVTGRRSPPALHRHFHFQDHYCSTDVFQCHHPLPVGGSCRTTASQSGCSSCWLDHIHHHPTAGLQEQFVCSIRRRTSRVVPEAFNRFKKDQERRDRTCRKLLSSGSVPQGSLHYPTGTSVLTKGIRTCVYGKNAISKVTPVNCIIRTINCSHSFHSTTPANSVTHSLIVPTAPIELNTRLLCCVHS